MARFFFLTPKQKGKKAAYELRTGKRFTNSFKPKRNKQGRHLKVSKLGRAYRAGYLDARKDLGHFYRPKKVRKKYNKSRVPLKGAYNLQGRINEGLVDDFHGPVVFFDSDFDFTPTGRIKGSYNENGFS